MDIGHFLDLLSPVPVYESGYQLALFIASVITPFLLAVAIGIRTLESQLDAVTNGRGRWGRFIRDMGIWVTVLAVYFGLALIINETFMSLYRTFAARGSLSLLMDQFSGLMTTIDAANNSEGSFTDNVINLFGTPVLAISYFVYYVSLILVVFVGVFLQLAHAIAYALSISWGLVAIPMSITASFRLLGPWAKFSAIVLVWPILHYIAFALFTPLFVQAAQYFIDGDPSSVTFDQAQVYLLATVVNFIACALIVAAPFLAQSLINSGSITGLIAPFAAAGMGAAGSVLRQMKSQTVATGRSTVSGVVRSANDGMINRGLQRVAETISPSINPVPKPVHAGPTPYQNVTPPSQSPSAPTPTPDVTSSTHPAQPTSQAKPDGPQNTTSKTQPPTKAQKQARRGAILDQQHKKGSINLKGRSS